MRILCLDIGEKRIGVAVSDPLGITAQGVSTITHGGDTEALNKIDEIVTEYEAKQIVIGLPLNMDGTESKQTKIVRRFAEKLGKRFRRRAQIVTWDERLSTAGAERNLLEADLSRARRRQVIDKMAAVFILQGYLEAQK
jgi:putative Holliday junction resolvase